MILAAVLTLLSSDGVPVGYRLPPPTRSMMFTVIAQFQDGTPATGEIFCSGYWMKYQDTEWVDGEPREPESILNLPFRTDSRGAAIFNPRLDYYVEEGYEECYALSGARSGKLTFTPRDGGVFYITIPGVKK